MGAPKISSEEVVRIAKLARLELSDTDQARMRAELDGILQYMEELNTLDLSDFSPTDAGASQALPLREDAHHPSLPREEALREAPASDGHGGFCVPRVLETQKEGGQ